MDGNYEGATYPAHFNDRGRQTPHRASWDGLLAEVRRDFAERKAAKTPVLDLEQTNPRHRPNTNRRPTGPAKIIRSGSAGRSDLRENEAASLLALLGYDVEQLPEPPRQFEVNRAASPDLMVNGRPWECYSPMGSLRTLGRKLNEKVNSQASRIVLNLEDFPGVLADLEQLLKHRRPEGIKELLAVRGGKLHRLI